MDFVGPFPTGENLLVLVDYYSRYPEVEIMKHITTAALEPRLRRIFARYGVPRNCHGQCQNFPVIQVF
jgi:hypothetical protein